MRLMREVRCNLAEGDALAHGRNAWSGVPAIDAPAPHVWLRMQVEGPAASDTGFVCDIARVDRLVLEHTLPVLRSAGACPANGGASAALLVERCFRALVRHMPHGTALAVLELWVTPGMCVSAFADEVPVIRVTQSFEFSASHRLHCAVFSAEENARLFGKCNNPNGHGHNYVLEVTVAGEPDGQSGLVVRTAELDRIVRTTVIDRFDHKHLNLDCPEFAALNPTVENIARVIYDLLQPALAPLRVASVRVWETPKTWAEYDGTA